MRLVVLVLAGLILAACAYAEPADYDPRDPCRGCPPGLFSGERGSIRIL